MATSADIKDVEGETEEGEANEKEYLLQVSNLSEDTDSDDLLDLFESQNLAGEITVLMIDPRTSKAIIRFLNEEDSKAMLEQKRIHYFDGWLRVSVVDSESQEPPNCCVRVSGVPESFHIDKLKLFFNNKERGGETESDTKKLESGDFVITFKDHEVARKVVERKIFPRGEHTFKCAWYEKEKDSAAREYPTALIISGWPHYGDQEMFEDMLEEKLQSDRYEIENFCPMDDGLIVTLSNPKVMLELLDKRLLNYGSHSLKITAHIEKRRDVTVKNIPQEYTPDDVKIYFQKKKRGGGPIETVCVDDKNHTAHIVFCNEDDASNIVRIGSFTKANGVIFQTEWYKEEDSTAVFHERDDPTSITLQLENKDIASVDKGEIEDFLEEKTRDEVKSISNEKNNCLTIDFASEKGPAMTRSLFKGGTLLIGSVNCSLTRPCQKGTALGVTGHSHEMEHDSHNTTFIEITGIPKKTTQDHLQLLLENKRTSGGGETTDLRYDASSGRAFVCFKRIQDAEDFVEKSEKGGVLIGKSRITALKRIEKEIPHLNTCAIKIIGVPESYSEDNLRDVFDNDRCGGGTVEKVHINDDNIVITFGDAAVSARVVAQARQKPIVLENQTITVRALPCPFVASRHEPDEYPNKVFLQDIPEHCSRNELRNFIEKYSSYYVEEITYGMEVGTAVVEVTPIQEELGFDPWKMIRLKPLLGNMLTLKYVEHSRSIEVYDYGKCSVTKIQNYMESKRRFPTANNDEKPVRVDTIEHIEEHECMLVTFHAENNANRVLALKEHKLEGNVLSIKAHHKQLGILPKAHDETIPAKSIPSDVEVEVLDSNISKFFRDHITDELHAPLSNLSAGLQWIENKLVLKCQLDGRDTESKRTWATDVRELVSNMLSKHTSQVIAFASYSHDIGMEIRKQVESLCRSTKENEVKIMFDNDTIVIVGQTVCVSSIAESIRKNGTLKHIKQKFSHIDLKHHSGTITIEGPQAELKDVKEEDGALRRCRLEVSGIPKDTWIEDLDDFFDNQGPSEEVTVVALNERLHTAVVECSLVEDAEKILRSQPYSFLGNTLYVCVEAEKSPNCCVKIIGFSLTCDEENLKYFFQNRKRGGEIESIHVQTTGVALITFKDHNVAKKVVETGKFERGSETYTVSWHTQEEGEPLESNNVLCIYGLPPTADKELLEDLLEAENLLSDNTTIDNFEKEEDHFLVILSNSSVVERMLQLTTISFGEMELKFAMPVEDKKVHRDVLIKGLPKGYTKEKIKLFFQSKRKTNGGPIENVIVNDIDHTAHITFLNENDACNVVEQGHFTRQNGTTFHAEWFETRILPDVEPCIEDGPNTITLRNFNGDIDPDSLEDFLEDRTGDKVESMRIDRTDKWAKISFESPKGPQTTIALAKDNILKLGSMTCSVDSSLKHEQPREELQVKRVSQEGRDIINFVEVSGIPVGTSEEFLKLCLESKDKSGGGEIDQIRYDPITGRAYLTFRQEKDGDDFVTKATDGNVTINKSRIKAVKRQEKEVPYLNTCAIVVTGVPESYSKENLNDVFENERYGGGIVEDIHMDSQRIVITFENPSVAANVVNLAQKSPIELEKHVLKIVPLPTPTVATSPELDEDPNEVLIKSIPENNTKEELQDFLERHSPYLVEKIIYGMEAGTAKATVSLREETNNDPWKEVRIKPISGNMLSIEYVPFSRSIEVYGFGHITETKLRNYFESRRCIPRDCNRGRVVHLQHIREHSCIVITFVKVEEADHVLQQDKHVTEGIHLNVKKHSKKLGILPDTHNENIPARTIPDDITIRVKNPYVYLFIRKNKGDCLQELLQDKDTGMEFIDDQCAILLTCKLDCKTSIVNHSWAKDVNILVTQFISSFTSITEKIPLQTNEAQQRLQSFVQEVLQENKGKDIEITFDNDRIQIIGEANIVSDIAQRSQEKISETMEYCKMLAERNTATVRLNDMQRGYLAWKQCLIEIGKKYGTLEMSIQADTVVIQGCSAEVQAAKIDVHEVLGRIRTMEQPWCNQSVILLLKCGKIMDKLMTLCRHRMCPVYMHLYRAEKLYLLGENLTEIDSAITEIKKEIQELKTPLTKKHDDTVLDKLESFTESLASADGEFQLCHIKRDGVTIIGLKSSVANAMVKIENFLEANETLQEFMPLHFGHNRLINLNDQEVEDIKSRFGVKIHIKHTPNGSGLLLCGNIKSIDRGKNAISDMLRDVVTGSYAVLSAGMTKYFLSATNSSQLEQLEQEFKVAIFPVGGHGEHIKPSISPTEKGIATKFDKLTLSLCKGNPSEYPCDSVFVMVQEGWKYSSDFSTEIALLGGADLHEEIDKAKASSSRLFPGTAFITDTSVNRCKQIIYCVEGKSGEIFVEGNSTYEFIIKGRNDKIVKIFYDAILQGLKKALSENHHTINIPLPIGSNSSASSQMETILKVIKSFSERLGPSSTLTEIRLIAAKKECQQLEKIFSNEFQKNLIKQPTVVDGTTDTPNTTLPTINLNLLRGELIDADADVIVNSTSNTMNLSLGAVSSSLLYAGGNTIQEQCQRYMKQRSLSVVRPFEIVPTDGGRLKCKSIYHAALEKYHKDGSSEQDLQGFVQQCLNQAKNSGYQSIAFPSLGTGNLAFPKQIVARIMLETVRLFERNYPGSSLKRVDVILWPKDPETIKAFESVGRELKTSPTYPNIPVTSTYRPLDVREKQKTSTQLENPKARKGRMAGHSSNKVLFCRDVTIEIVQGDITRANTDVIVYSTDKSFTFGSTIGKLFKSLAGRPLEDACKSARWIDGVAVTDGQFLGCKHLFHVDTPTNERLKDWKKRIIKCLELAEIKINNSIAFPAIGTGMSGVNPSIISGYMVDGIEEFISKSKPTHLKYIKMVVFDESMLQQFHSQLNRLTSNVKKPKQGWKWDVFGVTSLFGFFGSESRENSYNIDFDVEEEEEEEEEKEKEEEEAEEEEKKEEEEDYSVEPTKISLQLIALQWNAHNLNKVKGRLYGITREKLKVKLMDGLSDSEDICKLTDQQVQHIQGLERKHDVEIQLCKTKKKAGNYIEIQGLSDDVSDVVEAIHTQFRAADKQKEKVVLFEKIQWQYQQDDMDFEDYSIDESFEIEEAYKCGETFIAFEREGSTIEIDIKNMFETVTGGAVSGRPIRRNAPDEVSLPAVWSNMKPNKRVEEVTLNAEKQNTSSEFEKIFNEFNHSMRNADKCSKSFSEVVEIKRIQNPMQYKKYVVHKKHMLKPNEHCLMWHGTGTATLTQIVNNGFNRSYAGANASVYGKGSYFSKYAGYSHNYATKDANGLRHMFLCRVLTGDYTQGDEKLIDTPPKDPANPAIKYDSVVDNMENPTMFVVFTDTQAYPDYLISYKE